MKQKQLQLMAYIPKTTTIKLHYVGFPAHWKEKLAQLASAAKADYDYEGLTYRCVQHSGKSV